MASSLLKRGTPLCNDCFEQLKDVVVGCRDQILLRPKISLGGCYRGMTQKELDLLQFPALFAAQLGAGAPEVMRGWPIDSDLACC